MGEDRSNSDQASAWCVVLAEALALVLEDRHALALELLDAAKGVDPVPSNEPLGAAITLTKLRLVESAGAPSEQAAARRPLEELAAAGSAHVWSTLVHEARAARRAGQIDRATELMRDAVREFRRAATAMPPVFETLARVVTREVLRLQPRTEGVPHVDPAVEPVRGSSLAPDSADARIPAEELDLLLGFVHWSQRLLEADDEDDALVFALDGTRALSGAEVGLLMTLEQGVLSVRSGAAGLISSTLRPALDRAQSICREAAEDDAPQFVSRPDSSPALTVCLPLGRHRGAWCLIYLERTPPFGRGEARLCRLLELLASQTKSRLRALRDAESGAGNVAPRALSGPSSSQHHRLRYGELVGASLPMQRVYGRLATLVRSSSPVLVYGETGTGKEILARSLHTRGPRADKPFIALNCAGVPDTLLEAELYGVEAGAYTGADVSRPGLFERAHLGTAFLDEVGEMSPRMQAAMLRVLQNGEVRRVGGNSTIHVNVRVVAATHRDLTELVRAGLFRADLLYRLDVLRIELPPLRERTDDIPLLVDQLYLRHRRAGRPPHLSPAALERMREHDWPGNVRQLENLVREWVARDLETIGIEHLPGEWNEARASSDPRSLSSVEADAIRAALQATGGNRTAAARLLGIDRKTLFLKLKRMGGGDATPAR